jgi:plastocyanin
VVSGDVEGKYVYATVPAPTAGLREHMEGYLAKIDMKTWKVVGSVPMIDPIWPEISADGKTGWITLGGPSKVVQVDLTKMAEIREITTGPGPWGARLSYDETKLYVADKGEAGGYGQQGRTLTIIDTAIPIVTNVVAIGVTTDHAILSPDGKEIWATSNADHAIYVMDVASEKVTTVAKLPNDGDTHGSTFVRYEKTDKGIVGQVVSSFTGLRGAARSAQATALKQNAATVVRFNPRGTAFDPATLSLKPGRQFIRFINQSGTGGGTGQVESKDLGIAAFTLAPGESKVVEVTIPEKGTFNVISPDKTTVKPLVITAGAATTGQQQQQTGPRQVAFVSEHMLLDVKSLTVKAGETLAITFKNNDDEKHNFVILEANIVSPDFAAGRVTTLNLTMPTKAGTYRVICAYHPAVTFELKVEG